MAFKIQFFMVCKECKKKKGDTKFDVIEKGIMVCKHITIYEIDLKKEKKNE